MLGLLNRSLRCHTERADSHPSHALHCAAPQQHLQDVAQTLHMFVGSRSHVCVEDLSNLRRLYARCSASENSQADIHS